MVLDPKKPVTTGGYLSALQAKLESTHPAQVKFEIRIFPYLKLY